MKPKPYNSALSIFMRSPWTDEKRDLMEKVAHQAFEEQDKLSKKYDEILALGDSNETQ